ncbi:MAG: helix-turn-helix transcriptional regulator, partial [Pseudomonadota bacterium]
EVNGKVIHLSKKEFIVAQELTSGKTMVETAATLFVSPRTIETHINRLKIKLGVTKKSELIKKISSYFGYKLRK